jgi:hypothetical protein
VASGGSGDATGTAAVGVKSGGRSEGWASRSAEAVVWTGKMLSAQTSITRLNNTAIAPMVLRGMIAILSTKA